MIQADISGIKLRLETDSEIFSPSAADRGTLAMLSLADISENDVVLDLGCGCGIVGIYAAHITAPENVVMCDISEKAVGISRLNAELNGVSGVTVVQSDGLAEIQRTDFTVILSNPPYHTDFSVAKGFIENGYRRLADGGRMIMVTKRLEWYKNKLTAVFGGVRVFERDGYYIFISEKRRTRTAVPKKDKNGLSRKLMRKKQRSTRTKGGI